MRTLQGNFLSTWSLTMGVWSADNIPKECYPGEWPCPSSGLCIPLHQLCDGRAQCPEGEDETNTTAGRNCSSF